MKCSVVGCTNNSSENPEKYFFCCPGGKIKNAMERKLPWIKPTGKKLSIGSQFYICEDHFDLRKDIDYYKLNGSPKLMKTAYPHRNLTQSEMALQAKLDKVNWSCFVPSCENRRLMTDKKVVFFRVPEGAEAQLWRSAVSEEPFPTEEIEFCCEDHFDITMDLNKRFTSCCAVEYTIKPGILPSINVTDSKLRIPMEIKQARLADLNIHPRVILNNDIAYLYGSKFPLLIEALQTAPTYFTLAYVNDIKSEPVELPEIKTEPEDTGYECDMNSELMITIERKELYLDTHPLEHLEENNYESESESESSNSSVATKEPSDDPDVTTDDFSDEESSLSSDYSDDEESIKNDENSDYDDMMVERFECSYCKKLVINLETHIERNHLNFSKNVNRTICGLCLQRFTNFKYLRQHQNDVHEGKAYACDLCDCLTKTRTEIHRHIVVTHCTEQAFLCQHCGNGFKFLRGLQRHEKYVHGKRERTHACHLCEKKFFTSTVMQDHIDSVHFNLRRYQCNVDGCNKAFNRSSNLLAHQKQVHLKQNLYSCVICGKNFSLKCNLTAHTKHVHKT